MFWGFCNHVGRSSKDNRPDSRNAAFPAFGSDREMVEIEGSVPGLVERSRECLLNIRGET
jgi:hypothetical protein